MDALAVVIVGVVATAVADLWQQALKRGAGLPIANWALIGRWVAGMPRGVLTTHLMFGFGLYAGALAGAAAGRLVPMLP